MSAAESDPLLALLTDVAESIATLAARVDAIEAEAAAHRVQVNEALGTIAEISARTYYASKPPCPLPDDIINASVMDAMIERWPAGAIIGMSHHDRGVLSELDTHPPETIDLMIARLQRGADQTNAGRLRARMLLSLLKREKGRREKESQIERHAPVRSR